MLTYEFIDPEEQINSEDFKFVESFLKATGRTQIGWHYITDITWIYSKVKHWPKNFNILDAGGGGGPLQFLLTEMGFNVTNIDMVLSEPSPTYQQRYHTQVKTLASFVSTEYKNLISSSYSSSLKHQFKHWLKKTAVLKYFFSKKYSFLHNQWRTEVGCSEQSLGQLDWYVGNLCYMPEIPEFCFDAVVSLSALEHIPMKDLDSALNEIRRVLKPGAKWAITTSGTEKELTWLHEPSKGYCFSSLDLEKRFAATSAKYQVAGEILEKYRVNDYLKEHLADFYKNNEKFGMPWGIWDPKYIPVGLSDC